jgi:hypothetical protein
MEKQTELNTVQLTYQAVAAYQAHNLLIISVCTFEPAVPTQIKERYRAMECKMQELKC